MKKLLLIFILYFIIFNLTYSYEDKDSLYKRLNLSKQISKYSNNIIKIGVSETKGVSGLADEFIDAGHALLKIPKKYSLCTYYLFPFKYEILSYLLSIPGFKQPTQPDVKVNLFLLTYYLLYNEFASKQEIKNYIKEKKLAQYYDCDDIDEGLREYFPKVIPGSGLLDKEHYQLLYSLGYKSVPYEKDLKQIFITVNMKISNSQHKDMISPWTGDFEKFIWAYSIVMSRSFTVKLEDYLRLEGLNEGSNLKLDSSMKKNLEVNRYISSSNQGGSCLIAFVDMLNHFQPQYSDLRDRRPLIKETQKGNFLFSSKHSFNPGQEITHTYNDNPTNIMLFFNCGFVISNNIFNIYELKVDDNTKLSLSQFELCRELKCVDTQLSNLPKFRFYYAKLSIINEKLLNYGRVLYLNKDIDKKIVLKKLANEHKISYENEVMAFIYYFNSFKNISKSNNEMLKKTLKGCQKYRNIVRNVEDYWINEATKQDEWKRNKIYENLYLFDISFKKIVTKNMLGSINQIIFHTGGEIEKIKLKYFT
jgi:hypothetical protein